MVLIGQQARISTDCSKMSRLPNNITDLVAAEKAFPSRPIWDTKSDPRYALFTIPLIVVGSDISGFQLRAKASKEHIDRDALCQLEFGHSKRDVTPLWRCQWLPLEVHRNKMWGPPGFEGRSIRGSHEHRFDHNWISSKHRMRAGNLPGAVPIEAELTTLSSFLVFCGEQFSVSNMDLVELPQISSDLFWIRND